MCSPEVEGVHILQYVMTQIEGYAARQRERDDSLYFIVILMSAPRWCSLSDWSSFVAHFLNATGFSYSDKWAKIDAQFALWLHLVPLNMMKAPGR